MRGALQAFEVCQRGTGLQRVKSCCTPAILLGHRCRGRTEKDKDCPDGKSEMHVFVNGRQKYTDLGLVCVIEAAVR